MYVLTAAEMRAHEANAMASGAVTGHELMARAGAGTVQAAFAHWPELGTGTGRALVLCGPGNNGGDGYVIARVLRARGWSVRLFAYGDAERQPPDAAAHARLWQRNGDTLPWSVAEIANAPAPDLVIDALFGIGQNRPPPQEVADVLQFSSAPPWRGVTPRWVAVDGPTGLDLDSGEAFPGAARADLTVTYHCPKIGHFFGNGPAACGALRVVDIGLERFDKPGVRMVGSLASNGGAMPKLLPHVPKSQGKGHKYNYGHALVWAGGVGRGGAGRLAARAALRVGAGLVTLLCPPAALQENAARLDAVMLRPIGSPETLENEIDLRARAFCLGPGLGVSARTAEMVLAALHLSRRTVLDADALTVFEHQPERLFEALHPECLLTPHEGEFARLFPDLAAKLGKGDSRLAAVREAAARAGCGVLLKGPVTLISAPGQPVHLHPALYGRESPWLATAGAGDVLAGLITGLAAAAPDVPMVDLAATATWLHVEAARRTGPGTIADDLPEAIPPVLRYLGA